MDFKNYLGYIALLAAFVGFCDAAKQSKATIKNDLASTRALFPYLKNRESFAFGFADRTHSRLKNLAWHPTDLAFALVGGTAGTEAELSVYAVSGSGTSVSMQEQASVSIGNQTVINSASWHPSGLYIATGASNTTPQLNVYSYSGADLTSFASLTRGGDVQSVAWHPSGRFLAVGGASSTRGYNVEIYAFDEITPALVAVYGIKLGTNAPAYTLAWDPSGQYLAVGCGGLSTGKGALQLYKFNAVQPYNANSFMQKSVVDFGGNKAYVKALAWSPSGTYLAAGGYPGDTGTNELSLYTVADSTGLTQVTNATIDCSIDGESSYIDALAWDPQEQYLLVGGYNFHADQNYPNKTQQILLYTFQAGVLTPKKGGLIKYSNDADGYVSALSWSPSRQYVAVGGYKPKAYAFLGNSLIGQQDPAHAKELWLMEFLTQ